MRTAENDETGEHRCKVMAFLLPTALNLSKTISAISQWSQEIEFLARHSIAGTREETRMQIELLPYERHSLETLKYQFGVEVEIIDGFAQSLNALREICDKVVKGTQNEFRAGRVVVMGLTNHAHHLLAGGLQALEVGNGVVWSNCVRGLMETLGACVMILERPAAVTAHLDLVPAGKLLNAAERGLPGLGPDIRRLHRVVHPGSGAVFAGFESVDDKGHSANFEFGLRHPKPSDGREGMIVLANLAHYLQMKLEAIANDERALSAGKVVMIRSDESQ